MLLSTPEWLDKSYYVNGQTLTLAQFAALGPVTLILADVVTISDTAATIAGLTPDNISAFYGYGIDFIRASDGALTLTVAEHARVSATGHPLR